MMHPHTELRLVNPSFGHGVFATAPIPAGTIVYAADDLEIEVAPDDPRLLNPHLAAQIEKYSYIDPRGVRVLSWDIAKYVNHSCACNTMSTGYGFEVAIRDIEPGEEITDEYGMFNMTESLACGCAAPGCRGRITQRDLDHLAPTWDRVVREALRRIPQVEQPLHEVLRPEVRVRLQRFFDDPSTYVSVRALRYEPAKVGNGSGRPAQEA